MGDMLSYCGLLCNTCPIYLATREPNKEYQAGKRIEISRLLREHYGMEYEPEAITDCDGCRAEGKRLFSGCLDCAIRKCARQKTIHNCAYCPEYVCTKLEVFFIKDPAAKTRLDEVRNKIS